MQDFPKDVAVAIITHNSCELLHCAIESLKDAGCQEKDIAVIDVASTDNTLEILDKKYSDIKIIRLQENRGPNPARNLGIIQSEKPYVFLMDADTEVMCNTIHKLRQAFLDKKNIGVASPVVVYKDKPQIVQYAGTFLHYMCEVVNPYQNRDVKHIRKGLNEIGVASACGLLIQKEIALDIGLFDERYFFGKEDGEFTHRIRIGGYKIIEPSDCYLLHNAKPRGTKYYPFQIMNRWHFILKNYQITTLLVLSPIFLLHEFLQFILLSYSGEIKAYIKAIYGFKRMLRGITEDRKTIAQIRCLSDSKLLSSSSFLLPEIIIQGKYIKLAKRFYDFLLLIYWKIFRLFLPRVKIL